MAKLFLTGLYFVLEAFHLVILCSAQYLVRYSHASNHHSGASLCYSQCYS